MKICDKCQTPNDASYLECKNCNEPLFGQAKKGETQTKKPTSCLKCKQLWVGAPIAIIAFIGLANLFFSFITVEWYFMIDIVRYIILIVLGGLGLIVGIYCMKEFCKDPESKYQGDRFLALCVGLGSLIFMGLIIMVALILVQTSMFFYNEVITIETIHDQQIFVNSQSCDKIVHSLRNTWGSGVVFDYNGYQFAVNKNLGKTCEPWR